LAAQLQFKLKTFILRYPTLLILERPKKECAPCRAIVFNEENHEVGLSNFYKRSFRSDRTRILCSVTTTKLAGGYDSIRDHRDSSHCSLSGSGKRCNRSRTTLAEGSFLLNTNSP